MNLNDTPAALEQFHSVTNVARLCDVGRSTVWRWIREDRLTTVRLGGSTRIPHSSLEAFIEAGRR